MVTSGGKPRPRCLCFLIFAIRRHLKLKVHEVIDYGLHTNEKKQLLPHAASSTHGASSILSS